MTVISSSVSVSGAALDIAVSGNYFITANTYLESTNYAVIAIQSAAVNVEITIAGSLVPPVTYYTLYDTSSTGTLRLNTLASGNMIGGGILTTDRQLHLNNSGTMIGYNVGITSGSFDDKIVNTGVIDAGTRTVLFLSSGNDRVVNSGQIIGYIDLGVGNDSLFGGDGSITGTINLAEGNDLIDLRHAHVSGDISGGLGNDIFIVDDATFNLVEAASQGTDLVKSTVSFQLGANFENLQLLGASDSNGTGNTLANTLTGNAGDNRLHGYTGSDKLYGGAGDDRLFGDSGNDSLYGGISDDAVYGGAGNDVLSGDTGADRLFGAVGRDVMTGDVGTSGGYDDVFIFTRTTDSLNSSLSDRITDFHRGEDKIDLSGIDAKSATAANDAFSFITTAFTSVAGQLRLQTSGTDTFVFGDVNGDAVADFRIILTGNLALTSADFVL
jgi:Ca2+-binding RTX toxin-like protein